MAAFRFAPVTKARWPDFEKLFEAKGGPSYCWCMAWRDMPNRQNATNAERKAAMSAFVADGTPVGLLGYIGDEVAGWCSVAPRDTLRNFRPSRTTTKMAYGPWFASLSLGSTGSPVLARPCSTRLSNTRFTKARNQSRLIRSTRTFLAIASWASKKCSPSAAFAKPAWPVRDAMSRGWIGPARLPDRRSWRTAIEKGA